MTGMTGLTDEGHSRYLSELRTGITRIASITDQKVIKEHYDRYDRFAGMTGMTGMNGLVIIETGRSLRETALAMIPFRSGDLCRTVKTGTNSRLAHLLFDRHGRYDRHDRDDRPDP